MGEQCAGRPTPLARRWVATTVATTVAVMVLAALLSPPRGVPPAVGLTVLLFVGGSMHVASTGWLAGVGDARACARRHPLRFVTVPVALVVAGAIVVPLLSTRALDALLEAFFTWWFFHYAKQNVGIASLASTSYGAGPLRSLERRCIVAAGCFGTLALLARPSLLLLGMMPSSAPLFCAAGAGFALSVLLGLLAISQRPRVDRPPGVVACTTTSLCFSAPVFVVTSPYGAIGGMTIAHGLQYLGLVGLIAARPGASGRRVARLAALACAAVVGGVAIHATAHRPEGGGLGRALFGVYLGVVAAHFVVDAGLWRMRDQTSRAFVVRSLPDLAATSGGERSVTAFRS